MHIIRYLFSKSYRKHRWLRLHLSKLRPLYKHLRRMRQMLALVKLPPRYPRGDTRNIQRVEAMMEALHKLKED